MAAEKSCRKWPPSYQLYGVGTLIALAVLVCHKAVGEIPRRSPALLWGDLQPGQYDVGFRVIYKHDRTRKWLPSKGHSNQAIPDKGRPIRISVWYPAVRANGTETMRYGDYFHYDSRSDFREVYDGMEKYDRDATLADLNEVAPHGSDVFAKLCATPVAAVRNARPASGRFPVVLYAGGLGSRADANVELGEYLASHRYIIATVAQLGPSSEETSLETTAGEAGVHVGDLEFALRVLRDLPDVDVKHLAIAGHSAGGCCSFSIRDTQSGGKSNSGFGRVSAAQSRMGLPRRPTTKSASP